MRVVVDHGGGRRCEVMMYDIDCGSGKRSAQVYLQQRRTECVSMTFLTVRQHSIMERHHCTFQCISHLCYGKVVL